MPKNVRTKTTRAKKPTVVIVAARFNEYITQRLMDGCLKQLAKSGLKKSNIKTYWVAGSFEIPVVALKAAKKKSVDAVIALGCVIRGETYHFELVAEGVAQGIMNVSMQTGKPVILGVLSTDTVDQAYKRSEEDGDNKGGEAAQIALEMVNLLSQV